MSTIKISEAEYWVLVIAAEQYMPDDPCWKKKCVLKDCLICKVKAAVLEGWRKKVGTHAVDAREKVYAQRE